MDRGELRRWFQDSFQPGLIQFSLALHNNKLNLIIALLFPFIACFVQYYFWNTIKPLLWFLFYPAVFFSAWLGGLWAGVGATLLSLILVELYFAEGAWLVRYREPRTYIVDGVFLLMGLLFSYFQYLYQKSLLARISAEKKSFEKALQAQELQWLQQRVFGIIDYTPNGQVSRMSSFVRNLSGYTERDIELTEHPWAPLLRLEKKKLSDLTNGHAPLTNKYNLVTKEGREKTLVSTVYTVENAQGEVDHFRAYLLDVTEFQDAEKKLELAVAAADLGIWSWDVTRNIINWSKQMYSLFDIPEGTHITYNSFLEKLHEDDAGPVGDAVQKTLTDGIDYETEYRVRMRDGTYRWRIGVGKRFPPPPSAAASMMGIVKDVDRRKKAELELAIERENLVKASAAKTLFLATMSHEIRTPLNAILGLAQILESEVVTKSQKELVQQILQAGHCLLGLLSDILDLSKIEAGKLNVNQQSFYLTEVLRNVGATLHMAATRKGLTLTLDSSDNLNIVLIGDEQRLSQILMNLISNAIKFTERGKVDVVASILETRKNHVLVRFDVTDTGIGIRPDVLPGLFSPFLQADGTITRRYGGSGLGLSISKRLVELMGGTIGAESQFGSGSHFWFEVPFALGLADECLRPQTSDTIVQKFRLKDLRILVVDDNEFNLLVAEKALSKEGAVVTTAGNGEEALAKLRGNPQGFDIVLMDIRMPGMDGLTATRLLRADERFKDLPIVALTAGAFAEDREEAYNAGLNEFLAKPINLVELKKLVWKYSQQKEIKLVPLP